MKPTNVIRMGMAGAIGLCAFGLFADTPRIGNVVARQRWPWNRLVDIQYVLTCDPASRADIGVALKDGPETLEIMQGALSGDLYGVAPGSCRIVWNPLCSAYTNNLLTQFNVELTPLPVPLYMIVDLTNLVAGGSAHVKYVYEADLTNDLLGAWERRVVTNGANVLTSLVWTGVATNDIYKTDKLVLRRVCSGSFGMGDARVLTEVHKDFYLGVFEVTQEQWLKIKGGLNPANFKVAEGWECRPVESVSYNIIRGAVPEINWPDTGDAVEESSFLGLLRDKTGISGFDLPTEAQWEYTCRAGTSSYWNDGVSTGVDVNSETNILNGLAWWNGNGSNTTHTVGLKTPNAWGLFDMHGNVWELCRDWYSVNVDRARRGGRYDESATDIRCAFHKNWVPSVINQGIGFRVVRSLP